MSTVFRALDLQTGKTVGLKLIKVLWGSSQAALRFSVEAQVLSRLSHPNIVPYIAHGRTASGQPYLAMEWLHGEDLATRLQRQPLSLAEIVTLASGAAAALSYAHQRGVLHRDIKPSNLFLRDGLASQLVLLDFGLARESLGAQPLTQTGAILGTPEYMSPEQARGQRDIGPQTDVFSLGCVLYECLVGHAPFTSSQMTAHLAKLLWDEVVPVRDLRPDAPAPLADLVELMLAKEPALRPADGGALLRELQALTLDLQPEERGMPVRRDEAKLASDQLLLSVVLARPGAESSLSGGTLEVEPAARGEASRAALDEALRPFAATAEWLADGSLIVVLRCRDTATDLAEQAVRCAQCIRSCLPDALIAIATGHGRGDEIRSAGEVLDRVITFFLDDSVSDTNATPGEGRIMLDELTAALIDLRYVTLGTRPGLCVLVREREPLHEVRPVLDNALPCVGRERELALLDALFQETVDEQIARVALVVAAAGQGKTRLRHELTRRLRERGESHQLLLGRALPEDAERPGALLIRILCALHQIAESEPAQSAQALLMACLGVPHHDGSASNLPDTTARVPQLPSTPVPGARATGDSEAARRPTDTITQTFLNVVCAALSTRAVVVVLEDLQWADRYSLVVIGSLLRTCAAMPLMILATARPGAYAQLPNLWREHSLNEIRLESLPRVACTRLVGIALGAQLPAARLEPILEYGHGNALLLEECIRGAARETPEVIPTTLLAIEQGKMMQLPATARRVLRAASIFGTSFAAEGVHALLASAMTPGALGECLQQLLSAELIVPQRSSRADEPEAYRFVYKSQREAAYALIPEAERAAAHRAACAYLASAGETPSMVLAEHARRGGNLLQAATYCLRAAEQATAESRFADVVSAAERGIGFETTPQLTSSLRSLQAYACLQLGEYERAYRYSTSVIANTPAGTLGWFSAHVTMSAAAHVLGRTDWLEEVLARFDAGVPPEDISPAYLHALATFASLCARGGYSAHAARYLALLESLESTIREDHPEMHGWLDYARSWTLRLVNNEPWTAYEAARRSREEFERIGNPQMALFACISMGLCAADLSLHEEAAAALRVISTQSLRNSALLREFALPVQAVVRTYAGTPEAYAEAEALCSATRSLPLVTPFGLGTVYCAESEVLLHKGALDAAEQTAQRACDLLSTLRQMRIQAMTTLSRIYLRRGETALARSAAEDGLALCKQLHLSGEAEVRLRECIAESDVRAGGTLEGALERSGLRALVALRASRIPDARVRAMYLAAHPLAFS